MNSFMELLSHFPGFVPSVLMGALLVFWLLAIIGVLDFDSFGPHFDADVHLETDVDVPEHGGGGSHAEAPETLMALGLDKLPFSIVVSGVVFFWWLLTLLAVSLLWTWIPLPAWIAGSLILIAALILAVPLAARAAAPEAAVCRACQCQQGSDSRQGLQDSDTDRVGKIRPGRSRPRQRRAAERARLCRYPQHPDQRLQRPDHRP